MASTVEGELIVSLFAGIFFHQRRGKGETIPTAVVATGGTVGFDQRWKRWVPVRWDRLGDWSCDVGAAIDR